MWIKAKYDEWIRADRIVAVHTELKTYSEQNDSRAGKLSKVVATLQGAGSYDKITLIDVPNGVGENEFLLACLCDIENCCNNTYVRFRLEVLTVMDSECQVYSPEIQLKYEYAEDIRKAEAENGWKEWAEQHEE